MKHLKLFSVFNINESFKTDDIIFDIDDICIDLKHDGFKINTQPGTFYDTITDEINSRITVEISKPISAGHNMVRSSNMFLPDIQEEVIHIVDFITSKGLDYKIVVDGSIRIRDIDYFIDMSTKSSFPHAKLITIIIFPMGSSHPNSIN